MPRAVRSLSLGPLEKLVFGGKRLTCLILGRSDLFMGSKREASSPALIHCWLRSCFFYLSSWEYKVWAEGNGPHQRLASVHLPAASPVPLHTCLQPYPVSVHTCPLPYPGQLVLPGLRSWVRMVWVPWPPHWTVPVRQSGFGMPCLLTLNSNPTYPPLTDPRNVRKSQGQDLKYYTMPTLEGPWGHAAHRFSVWSVLYMECPCISFRPNCLAAIKTAGKL